MEKRYRYAATVALIALAVTFGAAPGKSTPESVEPSRPKFSRRNPFVEAVEKTRPSIVTVKVDKRGNWGKKEVVGTGVIVDERGWIITNSHVISNAEGVRVLLFDGTELTAQTHTNDSSHDLAILRVTSTKKLKALPLGPGTDLLVGETVMAVGHPYGYTNSVSTGIISALGREIQMPSGANLTNLIQTNTSINPGNSGGPLLNVNGELIGINVALREGAQGIAFALNGDMVQRLLAEHLSAAKLGKLKHGLVCKEMVIAEDGEDRQQVVIDRVVEQTPAATSGLKSGDVLKKIGLRKISNRFDVERALWDLKQGDKIEATVMREGKEKRVAMTLGGEDPVKVAANRE